MFYSILKRNEDLKRLNVSYKMRKFSNYIQISNLYQKYCYRHRILLIYKMFNYRKLSWHIYKGEI